MQYHYAPDRNFEDFASGRVFYTRPGQTAFPVRLTSEIFQRCLAHWQKAGGQDLCTIYDPTCGGAYWLVVLAFLHWDKISAIYASDVDGEVIKLAERNLFLLTPQGLARRITEIEWMRSAYGKASHAGALESAYRFRDQLTVHFQNRAIFTHVFQANSTDKDDIRRGIQDLPVDIVLADVPYGWHSVWRGPESGMQQTHTWQMLDAVSTILSPTAIVAIVADKREKIQHGRYQRLERFQVGKRQIAILRLKT